MPLSKCLNSLLFMNLNSEGYDYSSEHVYASNSGAELPFCNRVYGTADTTKEEIDHVLKYYNSIPFRWFVEERNSSLKRKLEDCGLKYLISFPAMRINLNAPNQDSYTYEIRSVDDVTTWCEITCQIYGIVRVDAFARYIAYLIQKAKKGNCAFYIGYYEGIPAAVSMSIKVGDCIGLHWVGTLPEFRGKGLGYQVSSKPLFDAQDNGCTSAYLFASKQGVPLYEKIGFTQYENFDVYGF